MVWRNKAIFDKVFDPVVLEESHNCFHAFVIETANCAQECATKEWKRNVTVTASPKLIYETFISAYSDIARYKQFHFEHPQLLKSDAVKRAAYFAKWVVQFRPILVLDHEKPDDPSPDHDPVAFINEDMALQWGLLCIAQDHGIGDLYLRRKVHLDFLYYLHFREIAADGWLAIFQLLHDVAGARIDVDNPLLELPLT
jgi:hypothetical protein